MKVLESIERKYAARAKVVNGVKEPSDGALIAEMVPGFGVNTVNFCHFQIMSFVPPDQEGSIAQNL